METFFNHVIKFLKEIVLFGVDAFMVAMSREVARRFWVRLSGRGGTIAALEAPKQESKNTGYSYGNGGQSRQSRMDFLDEYT
jgi:hypothetical protein